MEFIAAVDAAGLVGSVVPTVSSGAGEVDEYFGRYLADTLRVGQRLAPGFYLISVGPYSPRETGPADLRGPFSQRGSNFC